jgi:hypothetical protein
VANLLARLLLGNGTRPDAVRAELDAERVVVCEEGLGGSLTFRHFKAPGRRSNWRKQAIVAALVVTERRLAVYARGRPLVDVAFDDPRFGALDLDVDGPSVSITFDVARFHDDMTGELTVRVRPADPAGVIAALRARA